ncbi:MAG: hypothetical protein JEZ06_03670 [Anaerolineaceae bacterium]|nr:hypothetical protein [Anaerolineaceae bacterium]
MDDLDTSQKGIIKKLVTKAGQVFQNPDHPLFNCTVWSEIAYGPKNIDLPENEVKGRVEEAAQIAGVQADIFDVHPYFLDKGLQAALERRRLF